jgi:Tol biopolymer transport system component
LAGRFSPEPDPHWVAYQSDETGRSEIYIASFPDPRLRLQVTSGGGSFPAWGPDTKELFYISADEKLMVVALKTGRNGLDPGPPRELSQFGETLFTSPYDIGPDRNRILMRQRQPISDNIEVVVNWPEWVRRRRANP